ncbi:carboxypeptidase regulatory-like domain-containing protein [bacterium]|nr:carboxypeptidase regulatory-like domain-containing protein [bacterium]
MANLTRVGAVLLVVFAVLAPAAAMGQEGIDVQVFRPSIFNGNFLAIEDAHTLDAWCPGIGIYVNYASDPVVLTDKDDPADVKAEFVNAVTTLNGTLAIGLWRWLSVGADIPVHLQSNARRIDALDADLDAGEDPGIGDLEGNALLGDIKGELKFGILNEETIGVGLALGAFATFPTGDPEIFLGEGTVNPGGVLALEKRFGIVNLAANGGYLFRPERSIIGVDIGSSVLYGAGVSIGREYGFSASLEYFGRQTETSDADIFPVNPQEVMLTLRYKFGNGIRFIGGGGGGLTDSVGSPSYRLVGGVDYYPDCDAVTEGRLIVKVQDESGASMQASLSITYAAKPQTLMTDATGAYQATVTPGVYAVTASKGGYESDSGSATVKDGKTATLVLTLKKIPEPVTTLSVKVVSQKDNQPIGGSTLTIRNTATGEANTYTLAGGVWSDNVEPGSYELTGSADGYKKNVGTVQVAEGQAAQATVVLNKIIVLLDKIYFYYDTAKFKPYSIPVLEDALQKIKTIEAEGGFKKLTIEGHTSSEGTDEYNMDLSKRRATAVYNWLVEHGIPAERLEWIGYGETQLDVPNDDTETERELNRRVVFVLHY